MFLVDSHCHLDQLDLANHGGSLANALAQAKNNGVQHMLCVCITLADFPIMMQVVGENASISASVGLHPNEIVANEPTVDELVKLAIIPRL